jgi:MFS superfamily sulfate permease-like transporter
MTRTVLLRLLPFLAWLPVLGRRQMLADLNAGLAGAIIVLPRAGPTR